MKFCYQDEILKTSLIIGSTDFIIPLGLLTALKYLDTSFTLVALRVISSIVLLLIGVFVLSDDLTIFNIIGFIIGLVSIYMLSGFSCKGKIKVGDKKGLIGLGGALIAIIIGTAYFKYMVGDLHIPSYMVLKFSVSFGCIILYMLVRNKFTALTNNQFKKCMPYAAISALIFVPYFLFLQPNIFLLGPLSLGYKMLSYSLVVPIILSIIFLGEQINTKRIIALLLTIISIALFI